MTEIKNLGKYEITGVLGKGAMGVVYSGVDPKLRREVAIKTILKNQLLTKDVSLEYSERFENEAQAVAKLNHPNIVTVFDFGEEGDIAYLVMEFIRGQELKYFLDKGYKYSLNEAIGLMLQLLAGMHHAHENGVIHRDIKPANIMLDEVGRLKLTDFGVARVIEDSDGTRMGTRVGTLSYMSPEQVQGLKVDARADIFAAGIVFYQILTGRKPFVGSDWEIQNSIVNSIQTSPSSINPNIPVEIDDLVNKSLEKLAEKRFSSSKDFANELNKFYDYNFDRNDETLVFSKNDDQTKFFSSSNQKNDRTSPSVFNPHFTDTFKLKKDLSDFRSIEESKGDAGNFNLASNIDSAQIEQNGLISNSIHENFKSDDLLNSLDLAVKETTVEPDKTTSKTGVKQSVVFLSILGFFSLFALGFLIYHFSSAEPNVESINVAGPKDNLINPQDHLVSNENEKAISDQKENINDAPVVTPPIQTEKIIINDSPMNEVTPTDIFNNIYSSRDSNANVKLETNKKRYKISDSDTNQDFVDITIKSERNGFVYLLMLGSDAKEAVFILPNDEHISNEINKSQIVKIKSKIVAAGPVGTDYLLAIVLDKKLDLTNFDLDKVGPYFVAKTMNNSLKNIEFFFKNNSNAYGADLVSIEEY